MNFFSNFWKNFGVLTLIPISYPFISIHPLSYHWIMNSFTRRIFGLDVQEFIITFIFGTLPLYITMVISTYKYGFLPNRRKFNWYHFFIAFTLFMFSRYMLTDRRYYKYLIF